MAKLKIHYKKLQRRITALVGDAYKLEKMPSNIPPIDVADPATNAIYELVLPIINSACLKVELDGIVTTDIDDKHMSEEQLFSKCAATMTKEAIISSSWSTNGLYRGEGDILIDVRNMYKHTKEGEKGKLRSALETHLKIHRVMSDAGLCPPAIGHSICTSPSSMNWIRFVMMQGPSARDYNLVKLDQWMRNKSLDEVQELITMLDKKLAKVSPQLHKNIGYFSSKDVLVVVGAKDEKLKDVYIIQQLFRGSWDDEGILEEHMHSSVRAIFKDHRKQLASTSSSINNYYETLQRYVFHQLIAKGVIKYK